VKIGVFGAGSIGCYLGGRLIAAGHDVVLVGRMAAEIAAHGLTLSDYQGERIVLREVRYVDDAAALADCDVVLVTVKSTATREAGEALARVRPQVVVSFQNGVGNVEVLRAVLPRVLAGMVPFNVVRRPNGHFHNGTSGPLELERGCDELTQALRGAGFGVVLHDDLRAVQWTKLVVNLNNSLNALAGVPLQEQLRDRTYRLVMAMVVREALACLQAEGIKPVRIGRLIPRLAPYVLSLPNWAFLRVAAAMVKIDPEARSSMWEDLERRRPTEIEYLNGEIIRLGEKHGVPTPVNRKIRELVRAAEIARQGSPKLTAEALWADVASA
jgi:2-dehydropantoate 2-reductase